MASSRDIKLRIRSVENIAQITKAMEVVSMNKMRRSQQFALAARPYAVASLAMLRNILTFAPHVRLPDLLKARTIKTIAIVVVTTDKGLVGGFNDAVIRLAEKRIKDSEKQGIATRLITVGKKAHEHFTRRGRAIKAHFEDYGNFTKFQDTRAIADSLLQGYVKKEVDSIYVVYTHFKTTLKQEAVERTLLPTTEKNLNELIDAIIPEAGRFSNLRTSKDSKVPFAQDASKPHYNYTYTFEPSAQKMIEDLVENLLRIALHHVVLESNASEHSARMITMKNASDNAIEVEQGLTLAYNKVRQASITAEISEIVAGAEALQ